MKEKVSAVIITFNEATNLVRTLSQLDWCDEIIIVDSYSNDNTIAICREYGCKIFYKPFDGYGEQKQYAIGKAANDWILCLDADEYLTPKLVKELQEELKDTGNYRGYRIPMNLVFRGQEFKYGKESSRYFVRLFNRKYTVVGGEKVHEKFEVFGRVKKLKHIILHYSYRDIRQYISKLNSYSTLGAEINAGRGRPMSQLLIFFAIPFYFFKYYFKERNFLNGKNGFYWSVLCSFYHFARYIKIQDIERGDTEYNDGTTNIVKGGVEGKKSVFLVSMVPDE
jgi:glycosyltransferase involved in cell wall biosynthesis